MLDRAEDHVRGESGLVAHRGVGVLVREPADLAVERGREEHRLAVARQPADDLVDLRLEAHVQHPVCLVEHEDAHGVEDDEPALDQVVEPARSRDENVRAADPLGLCGEWNTSVGDCDVNPVAARDRLDLLRHLGAELAGRDEDERAGSPGAGLEALDDRRREGECLAGARRRLREDVTAGEGVRQDACLDREGDVDVTRGEVLRDARRHAELVERLLH